MNRAFLFNPQNDVALASGSANFTPPAAAIRLAHAAAPLLWWIADEDDMVLLPELDDTGREAVERWREGVERLVGSGARLCSDVKEYAGLTPEPWGWSENACRLFHKAGQPTDAYTSERLEKLRQLSHRRASVYILRHLGYDAPLEVHSWEELAPLLAERAPGTVCDLEPWVLKAPWSCSGRGVIWSNDYAPPQLEKMCRGIIARQGSLMVEQGRDKVQDFAMLFTCHRGRVTFMGYSLFQTVREKSYSGNLLADDEIIEGFLSRYIPSQQLRGLQVRLCQILTSYLKGAYEGAFGVDMMIYRDGPDYQLQPCVELNLRLTMGIVAHHICRRLSARGPGQPWNMRIAPVRKPCTSNHNEIELIPTNPYFRAWLSPANLP